MSDHDGLVFAYALDGRGGAKRLDWSGVRDWNPEQGHLWVHLCRNKEGARQWLWSESGLDDTACDSLLTPDTRPHFNAFDGGVLVILRGVNLNPSADPEDMVSLRMWIEGERIITVRNYKVMAVNDLHDALDQCRGPKQPAELAMALAANLIARMRPVITALDDDVDAMEEEVLVSHGSTLRNRLHAVRHRAIELRRCIAPQRDAMARMVRGDLDWFDGLDRAELREVRDRVTRFVEDLDSARERANVIQDQISTRLAEETNRALYVLSIVAAILLPLGFVTGLLGVNLGGIPGTDYPLSFLILCLILLGVGALELWLFKRLKWL